MIEQVCEMNDPYASVRDPSPIVQILSNAWIEELVEKANARYNCFAQEESGERSQASAILNEGRMIDASESSERSLHPYDVVGGDQPSRAHRCEFDPEVPGSRDSEVARHPKNRDLADEVRSQIWAGSSVVDNYQVADGMIDRGEHGLEADVVMERRNDQRFQHEAIL